MDLEKYAEDAGVALGQRISRSVNAIVHRAERDGARYILKVARPPLDGQIVDQFYREAAVLARLNHPVLPRVETVGQVDEVPYQVQQWLPGRPLSEWLEPGGLDVATVVRVGMEVLRGLSVVHASGYLHCDIKPSNVIWDGERAYLVDFGLITSLGAVDTPVGTPGYAAPEQCGMLERPVDERSDLYALGGLLYECLTGSSAYQAGDGEDVRRLHVSTRPTPLSERVEEVSEGLGETVERLMATEPEERFTDARSAWQALADHVESLEADVEFSASPTGVHRAFLSGGGRRRSLERLVGQGHRVDEERSGALSVVTGPDGVGKSRLVEAYLQAVGPSVGPVGVARCGEDTIRPYEAVRRLYFDLCRNGGGDAAESRETLTEQSPEYEAVADFLERTRPPGASPPELGAIARFFGGIASRSSGPAVYVCAEAQHLDEVSAEVMARLVSILELFPLQFIAVADDSETGGQTIRRLWRTAEKSVVDPEDSGRLRLRLEALDRREVGEFLVEWLGEPVEDEAFGDYVHSVTGGSPIHLGEYLELLVDERGVTPDWEGWRVEWRRLEEVDLSSGIRSVLERRINALDEETRRLCRLAGVWGRRFPSEVIVRAADRRRAESLEALEAARRAGIVEGVGDEAEARGEDLGFKHDDYRNALMAELDEETRQTIHQKLAEAAAEEEGLEFAVADHLIRGDGSAPELTHKRCAQAGRMAVESHAYAEAGRYLEAVERTAGELGRGLSAEWYFLKGKAQVERNQLEEGRERLEEAIARAAADEERARYQIAFNDTMIAGYQLERLDAGARKALQWLDEPVPESRVGLSGRLATHVATYMLWRKFGAPEECESRARERCRLLVRAYDQLSVVGTSREGNLVAAFTQVARHLAAMQLGPSFELVHSQASFGFVVGLMGQRERAEQMLDRAKQLAEQVGTVRAKVYAQTVDAWLQHIVGRPVAAARQSARMLREHGDQLDYRDRNLCTQDLVWNYGFRGHSRSVVEWFERWQATNQLSGADEEQKRSSIIYANAVTHARLLGRDALAERLRAASERVVRDSGSRTARTSHLVAVMFDEALIGSRRRAERAIAERLKLGRDVVHWSRAFEIHCAWARCLFVERAGRGGHTECLADYREAVEMLVEVGDDHPTLQSHARLHQGRLALLDERNSEAGQYLAEAERLARQTENDWVACFAARYRAHWLEEMEVERRQRHNARQAVKLAERSGWSRFAEQWREEFDLVDGDTGATSSISDSATGDEMSMRERDLQLQVDALKKVSMATSELLDPEEIAGTALAAAVQMLGAQRGVVFRKMSGENQSLEVLVGRASDGSEFVEADAYAVSVVEEVVETGEPILRNVSVGDEMEAAADGSQRSMLAVPLQSEQRPTGALYLENRLAAGVFRARDTEVLRAIASQVAVALATARSAKLKVEVAAERKRRAYADSLRSFTEYVSASLDGTEILGRLSQEIASVVGAERIDAVSVTDGVLRLRACLRDGQLKTAPFDGEPFCGLRSLESVWDEVSGGRTVLVDEATNSDRAHPFRDSEVGSWLAAPLQTGEACQGFVVVGCREVNALRTGQVEHVCALASQAGVALSKVRLATVDPLTGVHNRRTFFRLAEPEFDRADRESKPMVAMMIDLDDFKAVNDTHGHAAGDWVLEKVARVCRGAMREADLIGRYGGEEFAVVLPGVGAEEAARGVAERLRRSVEETSVGVGGESVGVSVSIGVAERRDGDEGISALLQRADKALYRAKADGKNCIRLASELEGAKKTGAPEASAATSRSGTE